MLFFDKIEKKEDDNLTMFKQVLLFLGGLLVTLFLFLIVSPILLAFKGIQFLFQKLQYR